MKFNPKVALATALLAAGLLYWDVVAGLVRAWQNDVNYSHGFLIPPMCAYFVYERRHRLATTPARPSMLGLMVVGAGLLILAAGRLGAELFLTRLSLVIVAAGAILFVLGRTHLRILALPLAFSLLMLPLPSLLFNQIAFPLQLLASRAAELALMATGVPVLREGNVIVLPTITLEVAEACSGVRSLMSLFALGVVYGYFTEPSVPRRMALALATVPIAVATNACRVAGTGVAAHFFGAAAAEGFFHTFAGWLVFMSAAALLFLCQRMMAVLGAAPRRTAIAMEAAR